MTTFVMGQKKGPYGRLPFNIYCNTENEEYLYFGIKQIIFFFTFPLTFSQ